MALPLFARVPASKDSLPVMIRGVPSVVVPPVLLINVLRVRVEVVVPRNIVPAVPVELMESADVALPEKYLADDIPFTEPANTIESPVISIVPFMKVSAPVMARLPLVT